MLYLVIWGEITAQCLQQRKIKTNDQEMDALGIYSKLKPTQLKKHALSCLNCPLVESQIVELKSINEKVQLDDI